MMETLLLLAAVAGGRAAALSLYVQAVGCGLTGLAVQFSDESALEVCNTCYALHKSTFLPFLRLSTDWLFNVHGDVTETI